MKRKEVFDRGYEVRYSVKIFKIEKVEGNYYILDDGRKFREGSLQKVKPPAENKKEEEKPIEEIKDVAKDAKFEHQTEQILKHKEGVSQVNRREGLRERKPENQLEHSLFGKVRW